MAVNSDEPVIYAHSLAGQLQFRWEPLRKHLTEVGEQTALRAAKFHCKAIGHALGVLHDFGKYKPAFQRYICGGPGGADKAHAAAGALYARDRLAWTGLTLAHAVAGHHAGLQDELFARDGRLVRAAEDLQISLDAHGAARDGLVLPTGALAPERPFVGDAAGGALSGFQSAFRTRMLFSCLIDSDRYCVERFRRTAEGTWTEPPEPTPIAELADTLAIALKADAADRERRGAADAEINRLRQRVFEQVTGKAGLPRGVFTLTVPTGGGKTLTGLSFALEHARRHKMDRVVVVIPFTSVIEQTAEIYRDKLGAHEVLEHHSAFEESDASRAAHRADAESQDGDPAKRRLVMETWSPRIVVTTAVQFFESLFSNRPTKCRKLHNLCNSVVVLDEAQTLPLHLLRPCVAALKELQKNYGASVVLCTATQPALEEKSEDVGKPQSQRSSFMGGFVGAQELAPDVPALFEALRRVRVVRAGAQTDPDLRARFEAARQALCVVNSRRHAQELFAAISDLPGASHLSTLMTPAHRARVLSEIRAGLKTGLPCRVVSTSLIEAGVDVDFPTVFRAEAGLDQLAQAAGRANREGRRDPDASELVVFSAPDHPPPKVLEVNIEQGRAVLDRYGDRSFAPDAIRAYFEAVYWKKTPKDLDERGVLKACDDAARTLNLPFEAIAKSMRFIDSQMRPVIVTSDRWGDPDGEAAYWIDALRGRSPKHRLGEIARKLQRHTVGIPQQAWTALSGVLELIRQDDFGDQFAVVTNHSLYKCDVGLTWENPALLDAGGLVI